MEKKRKGRGEASRKERRKEGDHAIKGKNRKGEEDGTEEKRGIGREEGDRGKGDWPWYPSPVTSKDGGFDC